MIMPPEDIGAFSKARKLYATCAAAQMSPKWSHSIIKIADNEMAKFFRVGIWQWLNNHLCCKDKQPDLCDKMRLLLLLPMTARYEPLEVVSFKKGDKWGKMLFFSHTKQLEN